MPVECLYLMVYVLKISVLEYVALIKKNSLSKLNQLMHKSNNNHNNEIAQHKIIQICVCMSKNHFYILHLSEIFKIGTK